MKNARQRVRSPTVREGYLKDVLIGFGDAVAPSAEVALANGRAADTLHALNRSGRAFGFAAFEQQVNHDDDDADE